MSSDDHSLANNDKAAKGFAEALQKVLDGQSITGLAKLLVGTVVVLGASPWWLLAEPVLSRAFQKLNNDAGRKALAAIAKEVEEDEHRTRLANHVGGRLEQMLTELFASAEERHNEATNDIGEIVESSAADLLARFGLQLHRLEQRLLSELAPRASVWRSLSPGSRALASGTALKPSDLLVAAHQAVRFVGRSGAIESLDAWRKDTRPAAIALVTGRGGSGKTRLAIEATARWRARQIPSGFLTGAADASIDGALSGSGPRVIVIDYAEGKPDLLERILRRIAQRPGPPVRLLLLARERGEWWNSLSTVPETDDRLIRDALFVRLDSEELALSIVDRRTTWREAVATFARKTELSAPTSPPDYDAEIFRRPLPLLMHALVALGGDAPSTEPELLSRVLAHEIRYLRSAVDALVPGTLEKRAMLRAMQEVIAVVTLLGGSESSATLKALVEYRLGRVLSGATELQIEQITDIVAGLYKRTDGAIAPLEPDLLGEELIVQATQRADELVIEAVNLAASAPQRRNLLTVLGRCARRINDNRNVEQLLRSHLEDLAVDALVVAVEGADPAHPIAVALDTELQRRGTDAADICLVIANHCPSTTIALAQVSVTATSIALDAARRADETNTLEYVTKVARLACDLANRLINAGQPQRALATAEEAVTLCRQLAATDPQGCLPHLAASLNSFASALSQMGHRERALAAAQEAVELYREADGIGLRGSGPELAITLSSLANRLADVGKPELALWAAQMSTAMYRQLTSFQPERFAGSLAGSLNNVVSALSAIGQREQALAAAEEAVSLNRQLASVQPDAYKPALAGSLRNLTTMLRLLRQDKQALEAAQEAVGLYRQLAGASPDAFLPDIAGSLNNLANILSALGQRGPALSAAQEAIGIYRLLANARPDATKPTLAGTLTTLASTLGGVGEHERALAVAQEATDLYRELAEQLPDAFTPDLARSLNNLSKALIAVNRPEQALTAVQESTDLYRVLAKDRPETFTPDLAMSLDNLAIARGAVGMHSPALFSAQEAANLYRVLAKDRPETFTPQLASSLNNLANRLSRMQRFEPALATIQEATDLLRDLAEADAQAFTPFLAASLTTLASRLCDLRHYERAIAAGNESTQLYRQLSRSSPEAFSPDLAKSLGNLGAVYMMSRDPRLAAAAYAEAVRVLLAVVPQASSFLAPLLSTLVKDYQAACKAAGIDPDPNLG